MRIRHLPVIISLIFLFLACTASNEQVKNQAAINTNSTAGSLPAGEEKPAAGSAETFSAQADILSEIPAVPETKESLDSFTLAQIKELRQRLAVNGVPGEWFDRQIEHETFRTHPAITNYFQKAGERQVDHDKVRDSSWYFAKMDVGAKIEKGKRFIEDNRDILKRAEARHGIHQELIAAVIGIETNFASHYQRGKFYAFNSLVSQYVFAGRKKFAVREITALYRFAEKTGQPLHSFTSSYAGAIGWGQFIPSSLLAFFIDTNGVNEDTDPFCIEDTIFSVENYLFRHNLSEKNIDNYNARYKAVFAYNHSNVYVQAVLFIYDGLRNHFHSTQTDISGRKSAGIY
ncbi:MAG: Membrane-bound lytic murein transglycosylase B precursor [Smithella sp. PtaU1.Bin162]|nr:MAG: Membrane-bound lytic murein transglycosylase B precursor [Smithella sp. PtaU1.Bin162]